MTTRSYRSISFEDKREPKQRTVPINKKSIFDLEIMISPSAEELTVEEIDVILFNLLHEFNLNAIIWKN